MESTRETLEKVAGNLDESMGARLQALTPKLGPVPHPKDAGRKPLKGFGKLDVDELLPDPDQPRAKFFPDSLSRLAASIREKGQLSPIRVRWSEKLGKWVITSGERRWRAAKLVGLPTIDCYFQEEELTKSEFLEEQLIENCLREDLQTIEEERPSKC